jgi:hypothetical protein
MEIESGNISVEREWPDPETRRREPSLDPEATIDGILLVMRRIDTGLPNSLFLRRG